jgi:hypothetical protein
LPVPVSAFVNGINAFDDFRFPAQTGTQDTYPILNPHGIVQAVQLIDDATTTFIEKLRFFFKINFQTLGQACTSLGSTYEQVTTQWWVNQALQYTTDAPIVAIARSSTGTIVADPRFFAVTQTPNNDLVISVTGGIHYELEAFLESAFLDATQCPTGKTQLVLQFGLEYTSLNDTFLVQGPRIAQGITLDPNCYNITTRSILRMPCTQGVCLSRLQLQTECRTALASGLTFASCAVGQPAAEELNEVFFDARPGFCAVSQPGCAHNGTGASVLFFMDKVRASIAFRAASQFLEILQFYSASTTPLNRALVSNFTMEIGDTVWAAAYFPYTEIQRHFDLSISNSTLFNVTAYDHLGNALVTFTYPELVTAGVISVGVKATRVSGMVACDALPGCDSFALDGTHAAIAFPGAAYLIFNVTTIIPGGYNGQGTLGSLVSTFTTQAINVSFPIPVLSVFTTKKSEVLVAAWVLTGVAGGAVIVAVIAGFSYYFSGSTTAYSGVAVIADL